VAHAADGQASVGKAEAEREAAERKKVLNLPEENLLYFLEKTQHHPAPWQREILRIVRVIAQYFYPQGQTKVMNEGARPIVHYTIMNRLFDQGRISEGAMLELLRATPMSSSSRASTIPAFPASTLYALGFAMMQDIERIATEPTAEDRDWFPDHRRQWRLHGHAARRLGQPPRRILHPASSSARR
jgi:stage V sporulation protein R